MAPFTGAILTVGKARAAGWAEGRLTGGSLALIVYVLHRRDPVFLVGVSITTAIKTDPNSREDMRKP